jgi:Ca2+-transporting ATPase
MSLAPAPAGAAPAPPAHAQSIAAVLEGAGTDGRSGLTRDEARRRLEQFGPNRLESAPPIPWWWRLAAQFRELVVGLLLAAALIAALMQEWIDAAAILAIVLLNAVLGLLQELKAERALAALAKLSAPTARVRRDGALLSAPAEELVAGDLVELEAGDRVPADARLLTDASLRVEEAALTGESTPVDKRADEVLDHGTPLADRRNMVHLGTSVAAGKASALVVATGMHTELGAIAGLLERFEREPTPLQRRLAELGKVLIVVCVGLVAVIFGLQLLRGGEPLEVLLVSVSLAVAAVPEGLPAVVTIALALGVQRMARRRALVRKLPSVETLGSVTVICTDKTGTLTHNQMTVREIVAAGRRYVVSGSGYRPHGEFRLVADGSTAERSEADGQAGSALRNLEAHGDLMVALRIGLRCNHAEVRHPEQDGAEWTAVGDPTEAALVVAARKAGLGADRTEPPLFEVPFDSQRKSMTVVERDRDGRTMLYAKGAPEVLLERSTHELRDGEVLPLDARRRQELAAAGTEMAARALRVLGLAFRRDPPRDGDGFADGDLVFAGLAGLIDPPRDEARAAVATCRAAGIRPVMITGDHPQTAQAIARELGIVADQDRTLTGAELDGLPDDELAGQVDRVAVYARVTAEHKLRVVRAWQSRGDVAAMTGDGVNDAPAVKAADIGIAMGVTGTDVTREAADMVLLDDNFATIVGAVELGRGIFANIQKFVHYLLSCNAGEVLFMFFAAVVGWPAPLVAIQILWINLVTDGLPALALGVEPPEPDLMQRRPRPPRQGVITGREGLAILVHGAMLAAVAALGFWWAYGGQQDRLAQGRSMAFAVMALAQLCFSFGCRSRRYTMPELGPLSNRPLLAAIALTAAVQVAVMTLPPLATALQTAPLAPQEWMAAAGLALTPVTIVELAKLAGQSWRRMRVGRAVCDG